MCAKSESVRSEADRAQSCLHISVHAGLGREPVSCKRNHENIIMFTLLFMLLSLCTTSYMCVYIENTSLYNATVTYSNC